MTGRLGGRTALITGGSRGIGAAIATRFASEGAKVVITYVSNKIATGRVVLKFREGGAQAFAVQANAADPIAVRAVVETTWSQLDSIDILVHNAGVSEYLSIIDSPEDQYLERHQRHFAVNVEGVVAMTTAAVTHLQDGGWIILVGSVNAHQMPFIGLAVYGASKAAVARLRAVGPVTSAPGGSTAYYQDLSKTIRRNEPLLVHRLATPVLAIGGGDNFGGEEVSQIGKYASDVRGASIAGCGHWLPEECPGPTVKLIVDFLKATGIRVSVRGIGGVLSSARPVR